MITGELRSIWRSWFEFEFEWIPNWSLWSDVDSHARYHFIIAKKPIEMHSLRLPVRRTTTRQFTRRKRGKGAPYRSVTLGQGLNHIRVVFQYWNSHGKVSRSNDFQSKTKCHTMMCCPPLYYTYAFALVFVASVFEPEKRLSSSKFDDRPKF